MVFQGYDSFNVFYLKAPCVMQMTPVVECARPVAVSFSTFPWLSVRHEKAQVADTTIV